MAAWEVQSECNPGIGENSVVLGGVVEGAIEVIDPSEHLQIVSIGDADTGIEPRPTRWTAFAKRQISQIKDQPLAIRAAGERSCAEKRGVRGTADVEIGGCQAVGVVINVAGGGLETFQRIIKIGRIPLEKRRVQLLVFVDVRQLYG